EGLRDHGIVDRRDFLHFKIVVAAAKRAHLVALALLRLLRHVFWLCAEHLTVLFNPLQVLLYAPARAHRPPRAAHEHGVHLLGVETDQSGAADAGWNPVREHVRQLPLHAENIGAYKTSVQTAHAARNVKTHAACRNDAAFFGIERGDAANGKPITPASIRHGVRCFHDAPKRGYVDSLFVHLLIHRADLRFAGVDHCRYTHCTACWNFPLVVGTAIEEGEVHNRRLKPRSLMRT